MEKVHFQLESTLPELRDLEEKGLFTRAELRQVTLRRTKHESNLVKRAGRPEDYLAYAEYEIGLERLRRMRWKRLRMDKSSQPRSISSHSIPRRIIYILRRSTEKFPRDLRTWLAYVDYAKSEGMGKVVVSGLTAALQLHPLEPVLYILLSQHYLDPLPPTHKRAQLQASSSSTSHSNSKFSIENIPPARKTLLLGLRFSPSSRDLWVEYIKLEVGWVEALRRRWKVLGILEEVQSGGSKVNADVVGGEGFKLDPLEEEDEDENTEDAGKGAFGETGESARKKLVDGQLVLTVLRNSFTRPELSSDLDYRLRLIHLFRSYPTGLRKVLLRCVYDSMDDEGLRGDRTARRVKIESGLFDREYDPEVDERDGIDGTTVRDPIKGESDRIAFPSGEEKVKMISGIVNALKATQDVEHNSSRDKGEERRVVWRREWEEEVGLWILRWAGRMTEGEEDLRKYLLASLTSLTKPSFDGKLVPSARLLADHLDYLLNLAVERAPSASRLLTMANEYTRLQPGSPRLWKSRLEIERRAVLSSDSVEERGQREAEVGRSYLAGMDAIGCNAGATEVWVQGLNWFDRFTDPKAGREEIMPGHWKTGIKAAKRFDADGDHGRALYSGVLFGWVESVLVGGSDVGIQRVQGLVDTLLKPEWQAPSTTLSSAFDAIISLNHLQDAQLAPLLQSIYEAWHRRARHDPAQKVSGCLAYVSWLLRHTKGSAKKAWDLVERTKREVETGEAGGLEGKGGLLRRDQKTIERERREMVVALEEGWRDILRAAEKKRDRDGESDEDGETDEDGSGSDGEDVDME